MSLVIRRAGPSDVPGMSVVLTASITQLCAADHGGDADAIAAWTRNKSEAGVAGMLANPDLQLFVAESATGVVAVGAVTNDGTVSLNYVAPAARFAGISSAMLAGWNWPWWSWGTMKVGLKAHSQPRRSTWPGDGCPMARRPRVAWSTATQCESCSCPKAGELPRASIWPRL